MSETKFPIQHPRRPTVLDDGIPLCSHMVCPKFSPTLDSKGECSDNDGRSPADAGHLCYPELRALLKPPLKSRPITRTILRCRSCRAWWSVHPSEVMRPKPCPCGGGLAPEAPPEVPYVPHKPPPGSAPSQ